MTDFERRFKPVIDGSSKSGHYHSVSIIYSVQLFKEKHVLYFGQEIEISFNSKGWHYRKREVNFN